MEVDQIPEGAWYCDMGTVEWASSERHDSCPLCGMDLVRAGGTVEVSAEGTEFDPPIEPDVLPNGVWYCDMGTVHYASTDRSDGSESNWSAARGRTRSQWALASRSALAR